MSVIIGIDPHKRLHAAFAIDERESELARVEVRSGPRQVAQLVAWAAPFECRSWAIESAGGLGYLLAQQLLARGEHVVDVPATLSSACAAVGLGQVNEERHQRCSCGRGRGVASAVTRTGAGRGSHQRVAVVGQSAASTASHARSRACCRLHALVAELVPGGITKEIVVAQADQLLASLTPTSATQRQRLELAVDTLGEIRMLDGPPPSATGHASLKQ